MLPEACLGAWPMNLFLFVQKILRSKTHLKLEHRKDKSNRREFSVKSLIAILFVFFALSAHAKIYETTVQCKRSAKISCSDRTVRAFEKLGCHPIAESIRCNDAATDPMLDPTYRDAVRGYDFCDVLSECHEPGYGNFGQVSCNYGTTGEVTLDLRKVSSGITLTTSVGLFRRMVTTVCK